MKRDPTIVTRVMTNDIIYMKKIRWRMMIVKLWW